MIGSFVEKICVKPKWVIASGGTLMIRGIWARLYRADSINPAVRLRECSPII